jgi:hypothetical protein
MPLLGGDHSQLNGDDSKPYVVVTPLGFEPQSKG